MFKYTVGIYLALPLIRQTTLKFNTPKNFFLLVQLYKHTFKYLVNSIIVKAGHNLGYSLQY